jgi:hypothetical protein
MRLGWLRLSAALSFAALANAAEAGDATLRYAAADDPRNSLVIEAASPERLRVEDGRGRAVIVRDGETYLVFPAPSGERVAARLEDYLAVGAEIRRRMIEDGVLSGQPDGGRYVARRDGMRAVGAWQGAVWQIGLAEPPGISQEIVVSDDPELADLRDIALAALDAFDRPVLAVLAHPDDFVRLMRETRTRGMPVSIDGVELRSVGRDAISAQRFELDAPLLTRVQLRALAPVGD